MDRGDYAILRQQHYSGQRTSYETVSLLRGDKTTKDLAMAEANELFAHSGVKHIVVKVEAVYE